MVHILHYIPQTTIIIALVCFGCSQKELLVTDSAGLTLAFERALEGTTIYIGECEIEGNFVIPQGVILRGKNAETSILSTLDVSLPVIKAESRSTVENITIKNTGTIGVEIKDSNNISIQNVNIRTETGIGIYAKKGNGLDLSTLNIHGPVTKEIVENIPHAPSMTEVALHGLRLENVEDSTLEDIEVSGIANIGITAINSKIRLINITSCQNRGTNLAIFGGRAIIEDSTLCDSWQGTSLIPAYGFVATQNAAIESDNLVIENSEGYGLLHESSMESNYHNMSINDNRGSGLFIQNSDLVNIFGHEMLVENNELTGLTILNTSNIFLGDGGKISETWLATRVFVETNKSHYGDGIHISEPFGNLWIEDITTSNNEKVQAFFEFGCEDINLHLEDINVSGKDEQLGLIVQQQDGCEVLSNNWNEGIAIDSVTASNDERFESRFDPLPPIPNDDIPSF